MRILTIVHGFHPLRGGAETAALEIAARTAAAGAEQTVLTAGFEGAPREEVVRGVRVLRAPTGSRRPGPAGPGAMLAFLARGLPMARRAVAPGHVVHAHFAVPAGLIALHLRRAAGVPYLVTLPGSDVPGYSVRPFSRLYLLVKPAVRAVWRGAAKIVAVSEDLRRAALRVDGRAEIEVIPSGVDARRFGDAPGASREAGRILVVGRLIPLKGQAVFLEALARVRRAWTGPLAAEILGGGPELENLRRQAARLDLSDVVDIPGFVPDAKLREAYGRAGIFVMPSLNDAAPLTVLEAMASGLPVVATAVGGVPEALPERGALSVAPGDAEAMAAAILKLLRDPEAGLAMGRENRAAAARFDWDVIAARYLSLFEEVAKGRSDA